MTNEELRALPEFNGYKDELLSNGVLVRHRIAPKFVAHRSKPEDVILFHDEDGWWFVDYHLEGGPYKRRALL